MKALENWKKKWSTTVGSAINSMNADLQKELKKVQKGKRCKKELNNNVMACLGKHLHIRDRDSGSRN